MAARCAQGSIKRRSYSEGALCSAVTQEPGAGGDRQIRRIQREGKRFSADATIPGDAAGREIQGETGKGEVGAALRKAKRLLEEYPIAAQRTDKPGETQFRPAGF